MGGDLSPPNNFKPLEYTEMSGLVLTDFSKYFGTVAAVDGINISFPKGELTALLGPSGCGKTTLLRMIAGLELPTSGAIKLEGEDITAIPANQRQFGMVFQSFALFPHMSVVDNVSYSLAIKGQSKEKRRKRALELLDLVRLPDYGDRRIGQLSGGQKQRVAIARALAQEPKVFLLDEPMSALDAQLREEMQVELRLLQKKLGITTIVVTHDQREAMTMADQIVVMNGGNVEQKGSPQEIYRQPKTRFVASFIGKANFLSGTAHHGVFDVADTSLTVADTPGFIDGSPVEIVCRPEETRISRTNGMDNQIAGVVKFVRDVGSTKEIFVETIVGTINVELPSSNVENFALEENVFLTFPRKSLTVFPNTDR